MAIRSRRIPLLRLLSISMSTALFGFCLLADDDPRPEGPPCPLVTKDPNSNQPKCISPYAAATDECSQEGCTSTTCSTSGRWWDDTSYPTYTSAGTTYGNTYTDDTGKTCQHKVQCITGAVDATKSCYAGYVDPDFQYPDNVLFDTPGYCYTPAINVTPTGCKQCSSGAVLPGGDWVATIKKSILCPNKPPKDPV